MSETMQTLADGVAWVRGMVLLPETTEVRPACMSHVLPSEYRQSAEHLITRLYDALAAAQEELAAVRSVEAWLREDPSLNTVGASEVTPRAYSAVVMASGTADAVVKAEAPSLAALGRLLKEGENG